MHQILLQAEDVVKVYEARLTERETTSLDPAEVQEYQSTLRVSSEICSNVDFMVFMLSESVTVHFRLLPSL